MWYYLDSKKTKRGPVADTALNELYTKHIIHQDTKVWSRGMKNWVQLKTTKIFKQFGRKTYTRLKELSNATKLFRGLLTAFTILVLFTLVIDLKRLSYFESLLVSSETSYDFLKCVGYEYHKISFLITVVLFILFIFIAKTAQSWIFTIVSNLRALDKNCRLSPSFSGWSLFIPILNFIHPFAVIFYVYKASKNANGKAFNIFDLNFLILWWFFTLFELLILFFQKFWFSGYVAIDSAKGILLFAIYHTVILTITCIFWIVLVSRIFLLQRKIFYK